MELIIKPTGRCNFNCTFCSASDINIKHPEDRKVPKQIKELITKLNPNGLIVTGGEPLMVSPDYYYELHDISKSFISITSNLKDFYLHPDKWGKLFKEDWFGVTTSFHYGNTRRWDQSTVYNEDMFVEIFNMFKEHTGKHIGSFISVINDENENTAMNNVYLAKRLGCMVRLNNAIGVGKESKTYQRYKIFKFYIDIIDQGLEDYECNCHDRTKGKCPMNTNMLCESTIRCCYVDNSDKLHIGRCDERLSAGDELPNEKALDNTINQMIIDSNDFIKPECSYCELFRICNACTTNRIEAKKDPNYCDEMKKLENDIIRTGWLK